MAGRLQWKMFLVRGLWIFAYFMELLMDTPGLVGGVIGFAVEALE